MADNSVTDGGVSESVNIIVDNEELAPIVAPKVLATLPQDIKYDLLYIHSTSNYKNFIALYDGQLCRVLAGSVSDFYTLQANETINSVKAIGNTLVVVTNQRMFYVLYKDGQYNYLGEQIPFPEFRFDTELFNSEVDVSWRRMQWTPGEGGASINLATIAQMIGEPENSTVVSDILSNNRFHFMYADENRSDATYNGLEDQALDLYMCNIASMAVQQLWANITKTINYYHKKGFFSAPLLIRYAVRLYDGSYIRHSVPILISYDSSKYIDPQLNTSISEGNGGVLTAIIQKVFSVSAVLVSNVNELENWSDVVKGIDFAISEPMYGTPKYNGRIRNGVVDGEVSEGGYTRVETSLDLAHAYIEEPEVKEEDSHVEKSLFYIIKRVRVGELRNSVTVGFADEMAKVYEGGEEALLAQPKLTDDYLTHHRTTPAVIYEVNKRLVAANIATDFYPGPPRFASELTTDTTATWTLVFYIKGDDGVDISVMKDYSGTIYPGPWLVYPDSRCYKADVYRSSNGTITRKTILLKEHPLLNCAYFFAGFNVTDYATIYTDGATTVASIDAVIHDKSYMLNKLVQYEVNNPFYFSPSGIHTMPTGDILGVATTTKALSQGQFGQFPLYVFCSDGIWAMETAPDGTYSNIVPMSRDVCINPGSITGIDGAVVFVSKRGVMMVSGSDVICLSDDMNGLHFRADSLEGLQGACSTYWGSDLPESVSDNLSFIDYITQCFIAYDYANQRLVFVNENCLYQYVYSIRSKTWHKLFVSSGKSFKRTLNSYPDCYLQENGETADAVYNFSNMDDVNDIHTRTFGLVISRAFDLEAPGILKTIMQLVHRGNFAPDQVRYLLYGSRDNRNYALLHSLKGSSYKSFKIALILNLLPTERLSWTELSFNPKFTNKLR